MAALAAKQVEACEAPTASAPPAPALPSLGVDAPAEPPRRHLRASVKRAVDLVGASLALLALGFPLLVLAVAVRAGSRGPALFRQRRHGLDGREIRVWKLRTMRVIEDDVEPLDQVRRDDPRVTALGRLLRRTWLDELPQLFNVLAGDMSLVGPRPHAVAHDEHYARLIPGYGGRARVKPGMTGWAQANGWYGETDELWKMERRVEHDLWYVANWSLALDLRILALTAVRWFGDRESAAR